MNRSIERS